MFVGAGVVVLEVVLSEGGFEGGDLELEGVQFAELAGADGEDLGLFGGVLFFGVGFEGVDVFEEKHVQVLGFDVEVVEEGAEVVGGSCLGGLLCEREAGVVGGEGLEFLVEAGEFVGDEGGEEFYFLFEEFVVEGEAVAFD